MLNMMHRYKVKQREVDICQSFTYPGAKTSYDSYGKCKRIAFQVFCSEFMKYKENNYEGNRHPILDCLDRKIDSYDSLIKKERYSTEPQYWCPACNWLGKRIITLHVSEINVFF